MWEALGVRLPMGQTAWDIRLIIRRAKWALRAERKEVIMGFKCYGQC